MPGSRSRRATPAAVVVGSGPNGLAAAVILARAGLEVTVLEAQPTPGGGVRTAPFAPGPVSIAEGLVMDRCAAVPAAAPDSQFFREFDLRARGVELIVPEISYAQPLDDGRAGVAWRDLARTAAGLGKDEATWLRLLGALAHHRQTVADLALSDKRSIPPAVLRNPGAALAFGAALATLARPDLPGERGSVRTRSAGRFPWRTAEAEALITGVAAHTITRIPSGGAAGTAAYLATLAHGPTGWPLVAGGIGAITTALVQDLRAHGGRLVTDHVVSSGGDLPPADVTLLDTHARIASTLLAEPYRSRLRSLPVGAGACKIDYVLAGPIPWAHPDVAAAGTVHVCGDTEDMMRAEAAVAAGVHADRPMMLVQDPATHDPGRLGTSGLRPVWSYVHVPRGSTRSTDVLDAAVRQMERFAPGFRDLVVHAEVTPAAQMGTHNMSYVDGDIAGGRVSLWHMVARPTLRADPYRVAPGVWLCSQSTPPGPGVHGMSGYYAARSVLRSLGMPMPQLSPSAQRQGGVGSGSIATGRDSRTA